MKIHKLLFSFLLISLFFSALPVYAAESLSAGDLIHSAVFSFTSKMARFAGIIFLNAGEQIYYSKTIQDAIIGISKNSKILKEGLFTQDARDFTAGLIIGFEKIILKIKAE